MEFIPFIPLLLLAFSLSGNAFLAFQLRQVKKKPRPTTGAEDLLHDLTRRGSAVIRVEVIDPANIFLRSPKL